MVRPVTDDDIGLKVLYEGPSDDSKRHKTVDIVAIHGIGAHPDDSWCRNVGTAEDPQWINWLHHASMLPTVATNARIMRYGYQSQWFGEGAIRQKVSTVAQRLLLALRRGRKDNSYRPLIFIAHCFGGLVILKALLDAKDDENEWPGLFVSITGILFFGTPFRGAGGMSQAEMIEAARREYVQDEIQPEVLNILGPGNEFLQHLIDRFVKIRRQVKTIPVACFYELKATNIGKIVGKQDRVNFVVSESSGCLDPSDSTDKYSLSRTHFDMNKFGKPTEEDFLTVSEVIERMMDGSHSLVTVRSKSETRPLDTLSSKRMPRFLRPSPSKIPDRHLNFRLRGIPSTYESRADVRDLVRRLLSIPTGLSVTIHSLTPSVIDQKSKVATLSFHTIPSILSRAKNQELVVQIPGSGCHDANEISQNVTAIFDTHFSGLTPLHHDGTDSNVDIVAIPGAGGHAFGSFRQKDGSFMWLRDALAMDIPNARILTYGFQTRRNVHDSSQSLSCMASDLRTDIKGARKFCPSRPIIFVVQGIGGLILKEAMIQCKREMDENDKFLLQSVCGYFFFGVPHKGTKSLSTLVPLVKDDLDSLPLDLLIGNSEFLEGLHRDFSDTVREFSARMVSFYELDGSPTAVERANDQWELAGKHEILVEMTSAICGSKNLHPVNLNHAELLRYTTQYDPVYQRVLVALLQVVEKVPRLLNVPDSKDDNNDSRILSEQQLDCIQSLSFREQESRYHKIHSANGTCQWLLDDRQYRLWTCEDRGLFWVKGNPGAGKSVLMKFAFDTLKTLQPDAVIVSFFIHGRGTILQKSTLGMFRALLNSLLEHFPRHLQELTKKFEERQRLHGSYQSNRWEWAEEELRDFFSKILKAGCQQKPVTIFVDALDELGKDAGKSLITYFKELIKDESDEKARIKICFSSRHYPVLGHDVMPIVNVEERNHRDIRLVVEQRLAEVAEKEDRRELQKGVLLKAQGGFQWAILVTDQMKEQSLTGTSMTMLRNTLTSIPEGLDELYADILSDWTEPEAKMAMKLFQWMLFSKRPLSVPELREALAAEHDRKLASLSELRRHSAWIKDIRQFEKRVKHLSRGLIEFQTRDVWEQFDSDEEDWSREAQFIHQSTADYILNRLNHHDGNGDFQFGHLMIVQSSMRYLMLEQVLDGNYLPRTKLSANFPLAPYAVRFFFEHISLIDGSKWQELEILNIMEWGSATDSLEKLSQLWRTLDPDYAYTPYGWPFIGATPLHLYVVFGSLGAVKYYLENDGGPFDKKDRNGNTPLHISIRERHQDIAFQLMTSISVSPESLLDHCGNSSAKVVIDLDALNDDLECPLQIAVEQKQKEIIHKLLQLGASPERAGRDLLAYAIQNRDMRLFGLLLEKQVQLDGAIYFASKLLLYDKRDSELASIIQKLVELNANIEKSRDWNADELEYDMHEVDEEDSLSLALLRKNETLLVLLSYKVNIENYQCWKRYNPIVVAIESDMQDIETIVDQYKFLVDKADHNGTTPLLTALLVSQPNPKIIRMLLAHGASFPCHLPSANPSGKKRLLSVVLRCRNVEIVNMLLPLATTELGYPEDLSGTFDMNEISVEAVCWLLERKKISPNMVGSNGWPLLACLAWRDSSYDAVKRLLSESGLDANVPNSQGQSPLAVAWESGAGKIFEALWQADYPVPSSDDGDSQSVKRLTQLMGVDKNLVDDQGCSPLMWAVRNRHTRIVELLFNTEQLDINSGDKNGIPPFCLAIDSRDLEMVKLFMSSLYTDVNSGTKPPPLWRAAMQGLKDIVKLILDSNRADINWKDPRGRTLLFSSVEIGEVWLVHLLLNCDATDVDFTPPGCSHLTWLLTSMDREDLLNLVLGKSQTGLKWANKEGKTLLHHAVQQGKQRIVQQLLTFEQTEIDRKCSKGLTPVWYAIAGRRIGIIKLFLKSRRADVSFKSHRGSTLLGSVAANGDATIIELLLDVDGINPEIQDPFGNTPLIKAAANGHVKVVELLLNTGVNMNKGDRNGMTALGWAKSLGKTEVVELLTSRGAS